MKKIGDLSLSSFTEHPIWCLDDDLSENGLMVYYPLLQPTDLLKNECDAWFTKCQVFFADSSHITAIAGVRASDQTVYLLESVSDSDHLLANLAIPDYAKEVLEFLNKEESEVFPMTICIDLPEYDIHIRQSVECPLA